MNENMNEIIKITRIKLSFIKMFSIKCHLIIFETFLLLICVYFTYLFEHLHFHIIELQQKKKKKMSTYNFLKFFCIFKNLNINFNKKIIMYQGKKNHTY